MDISNEKKSNIGINQKMKPILSQNDDRFFEYESVVSATECTGLIQTPPLSVEEAESYSQIYDIPHTNDTVDNNLQHE